MLNRYQAFISRTISKTRASVSSGYPNTEKQIKARGRRPSTFIVARCLDTPVKHELEFWKWLLKCNNRKLCSDMFCQMKQVVDVHIFSCIYHSHWRLVYCFSLGIQMHARDVVYIS